MNRAEFVERNLPIIVEAHRDMNRRIKNQGARIQRCIFPEAKTRQWEKREEMKKIRDGFRYTRLALEKEKEMWDEHAKHSGT